jgi:hypothetical protein
MKLWIPKKGMEYLDYMSDLYLMKGYASWRYNK